jgi:hypothetical protein
LIIGFSPPPFSLVLLFGNFPLLLPNLS